MPAATPTKKFSFGAFVLGILLGILLTTAVLGLVSAVLVTQVLSGAISIDTVLDGTGLREAVEDTVQEYVNTQELTSVGGELRGIETTTLTVRMQLHGEDVTQTFYFDGRTEFLFYREIEQGITEAHSVREFQIGDSVNVQTEEPVRAGETVYARKVIKL